MKIHSMLPFLERKEINLLIDEVLAKKIDLKLVHVLPFADEEKLDEVVDRALNDDSVLVYLNNLLPFMNDRQMNILYDAYQDGLIKSAKTCEGEILPFLSKEKIKAVFEKQLTKMKLSIKEEFKSTIEELKSEEK